MDWVVGLEEVLRVIERTEGCELGSLWIDDGKVFCRDEEGLLQSICRVGDERWLGYRASELACRVLADVKGSPLRLPLRQLD
jgi:hypothetical protein